MATTTVESLSEVDRADLTKRLSVYNLDPTAVIQPDLVVPANSTLTLSASDPKSFVQPHILSTSNLDTLKTWIGVPDTLYAAGKLERARTVLPKPVVPGAAKADVSVDDIRTAASAYLFGESTLVSSYKPIVESYFPNFQIPFWLFYTITVNGVLFFGPGQNVLSAWKIVINPGGFIWAPFGNLKTNSTILQKT
jgi:hypothetical protein